MSKTRPKYINEETIGDGNCAFNSFALGLCNETVFKKIEARLALDGSSADSAFKTFIEKVAPALAVEASWEAVKQKLLALRLENKKRLQTLLAQPLRDLAIDLASDGKTKEEYMAALENNLVAVFKNQENSGDDIFNRHEFINQKFGALRRVKAPLDSLKTWWKKEGFGEFQKKMKVPGTFAGDLELIRLADYFGVNYSINSPRFGSKPVRLHTAHGKLHIPSLTYQQASELAHRKIIDATIKEKEFDPNHPLPLQSNTRKEVEANLSDVPNYAQVKAYLESGKAAYQSPIPKEWGQDCVQQLLLRGVINRCEAKGKKTAFLGFATDNTKPENIKNMVQRISAIADKEVILEAWQSAYRDVPTLIASNENAVHYENVRTAEEVQAEKLAKKAAREAARAAKEAEKEAMKKAEAEAAKKAKEEKVKVGFFAKGYRKDEEANKVENKWRELVSKAKAEPDAKKEIAYDLASATQLMNLALRDAEKSVYVSVETQKELDRLLAEELDRQERLARSYKRK